MPASAALLVAFAVLAAPSTRVTVGADLSSRAGGDVSAVNPRAELTPSVSLLGRYGGSLLVRSSYAPRLTFGTRGLDALHLATLSAQWAVNESSALSVSESFSSGWMDFTYRLAPTDSFAQLTRALEPVPPQLSALSSGTDLNYWTQLSGRTTLDVGAGFFASGGLDDVARRQLPFQRGPYGSAVVTHQLSELDVVSTRVDGNMSSFSSGRTNRLVRGSGEWKRTLSEVTALTFQAGAGVSLRDGQRTAVLPVFGSELETKLEATRRLLALGTSVALSPWTNPLTGVVSNRVRAVGFAKTDPERNWHLMLAAGAAKSVALSDERALFAGAQAGFRIQPELMLHADVMAQRQLVSQPSSMWSASVGITYAPGPRSGVNF